MSEPVHSPDGAAYQAASKAQAVAADPGHSAWVSANAGSGKTKVLIDRVARLLLKKAPPDSILCVTYTKAAANEMLQRLFDRLGKWSVMEEAGLREELGRLERRDAAAYTPDELGAARALFAKAVETPGGLRIETIHAFCARILRRFPLEANIAPGFQEIDDVEASALWERAVRAGIMAIDQTQSALLDAVSRAGGGFGAMGGVDALHGYARDIAAFIEGCRADPDVMAAQLRARLKAPAMSEDALIARAMGDDFPAPRLQALLPVLEADKAKGSQAAATILRNVLSLSDPGARWTAYRPLFFTAKDTLKKSVLVKAVLADPLARDLFQTAQIPQGSEVQRVETLERDLKATRLFERSLALVQLARPILETYAALKRTHAVVDFDDLIQLTHDLLTQRDAADWVLYKLDGGLTHVLLDEAQDTSPDQWGLLNALTAEFFAGQGVEKVQDPRTLFVVGDEKQSIYSFQGADPQRFLEERQQFDTRARAAFGQAKMPDMAMSFRSSPEILAFVDQVSESGSIAGHPYVEGPVEDANLMRHTARRANQPGCVELWPIDVPGALEEDVPWHAPRDTQSGNSPRAILAKKVAGDIVDLLKRGDTVWREQADGSWARVPATPGDILILVQNRQGGLFDGLINALKAKDLPVAGADRLVLADHIGVQDCLNLMRFALLPDDDLTLAEILRGPFAGLVDDNTHLFPLAYKRGPTSLWARLVASDDPQHKAVHGFLQGLLARRDLPPFEFLSSVLDQPDQTGQTGWKRLTDRLGGPVQDPVSALLARAMAHDARDAASLQTFVADMDLDRSQIKRDLAAPNGAIRVMTVHGAKGLQAPIVILPDTTRRPEARDPALLTLGDVPIWVKASADDIEVTKIAREAAKARQLREHRRLLYVALTRAQDRLILYGAWFGARPKPDAPPPKGFPSGCWYGLCAEAMDALAAGEADALRCFGDRPTTHVSKTDIVGGSLSVPDWLSRPASPEKGGLHVMAASALLPDRTPVLPPAGAARAERLKRGRLIHALMERLPELPVTDRREAGEKFLQREKTLKSSERAEMLEAAMAVLEDDRFEAVFAEGGRAEAPIIGTGPGLPEGMLINGRVDRLVINAGKVLIVDFKTDRPAPAQANDISLSYLAQMAAYRAVLQAAYPNHKVEAALVWTDGPVLMALSKDLLAKALSQTSPAV